MYKVTHDDSQNEERVSYVDPETKFEHLICKIPGHYKYSDGIGRALAKLLSEGKIKLNLEV